MAAPLDGKIAVITGGSKGIGKATALALAKQGATIVVNYSSDAAAAEEVVKEIGASKALAVKADVSQISGIDELIKTTVDKYKKIDVLIANAAIMPMKTLEQATEEDFDKIFSVNVKGPFFLVKKAVPYMPEDSRVILMSTSLAIASHVTPNYLLYNATKGAIEQITKVLCKELAPKGITVNAVAPGPTGTELFYKGKSEEVLKMIAGFSPFKRIGTPEEIADTMAFMSGPGSRWITGQIVRVNGGLAMN